MTIKNVLLSSLIFLSLNVLKALPTISVAGAKTTNIVMPDNISLVDIGSKLVYVNYTIQKDKIITMQLINIKDSFIQTNMFVYTEDGLVYEMNININDSLKSYTYIINKNDAINFNKDEVAKVVEDKKIFLDTPKVNKIEFNSKLADKILLAKNDNVKGVEFKNFRYTLKLKNFYNYNGYLYFKFSISNKSSTNYEIDFYKVFVNNISSFKKEVEQSTEATEFKVYKEPQFVVAKDEVDFVWYAPQFTIAKNKQVCFVVQEANGDLHLKSCFEAYFFNSPSVIQVKKQ